MKTLSILGCGWVGKAFLDTHKDTYHIKASVRTKASQQALNHKQTYVLNEENDFVHTDFYSSDVLLISLPPRGNYLENLQCIINNLHVDTQVILLSSTSVYSQKVGLLKEEDTHKITQPSVMLEGERLVQTKHAKTFILRLGGLMGYDRIAGRHSAGKTLAFNAVVNYIHRDDVVSFLDHILSSTFPEKDILNLVAPVHPHKKQIFDSNAQKFSFKKTKFNQSSTSNRIISSKKLISNYAYTFIHSDPLSFWNSFKC